jgi:hypothetical protein
MKFWIAAALFAFSSLASASEASPVLSCEKLDRMAADLIAAGRSPGHDKSSFYLLFPDAGDSEASRSLSQAVRGVHRELRLKQIRSAYELYHGSSEGLSPSQMNRRAEGIYFASIQGAGGLHYDMVSVGFGGGNGAQILFVQHTARFAGIQIVDGVECLDLR